MPIPSYKHIHLISSNDAQIHDQLSQHQFGKLPYIISIDHLKNDEKDALEVLEQYLSINRVMNHPYPIYVITNINRPENDVFKLKSREKIPHFFKQKIKPLNVKENAILHRVTLLQNSLSNLREDEFKPTLNEYARGHKALTKLVSEHSYMRELKEELKSYYDEE